MFSLSVLSVYRVQVRRTRIDSFGAAPFHGIGVQAARTQLALRKNQMKGARIPTPSDVGSHLGSRFRRSRGEIEAKMPIGRLALPGETPQSASTRDDPYSEDLVLVLPPKYLDFGPQKQT